MKPVRPVPPTSRPEYLASILGEALAEIDILGGNTCRDLVEFALRIELSAYDLYRVITETKIEEQAKETFLSIAQAEKAHMKMIARAIRQCDFD